MLPIIEYSLATGLMARAMVKVARRSHRIQTMVGWEAGLELEMELH
jgi:hypothetical protein